MISTLLHILVILIVLGLLWWAVTKIFGVLPIAEPFRTVISVILVLIACFIVLYLLLPLLGMSMPALH